MEWKPEQLSEKILVQNQTPDIIYYHYFHNNLKKITQELQKQKQSPKKMLLQNK